MKLLPKTSEEPEINLTPMIDVVFLLLLFFVVSTSFIRESSLKVDLPEASGTALTEQTAPIDVVIRANGEVSIDDRILLTVNLANVTEALEIAVGDLEDPHVIISADAAAEYQLVVMAMDASQQLGYSRLTLATRQKSEAR